MIELKLEAFYHKKRGTVVYNCSSNILTGDLKEGLKDGMLNYFQYFFNKIDHLPLTHEIFNKRSSKKLKMQVIESEKNVFQKKD